MIEAAVESSRHVIWVVESLLSLSADQNILSRLEKEEEEEEGPIVNRERSLAGGNLGLNIFPKMGGRKT